MPRAIAPDVTMTTSTPSRCSAATSSQMRAITERRSSPLSSATTEEPSLTTTAGIRGRLERRAGVQLEDDAADLDVVAGFEAGGLERGDHAHASEPLLDVRERLLVLEVVAGDEAGDGLPRGAGLAVAHALDLQRAPRRRPEDPGLRHPL